MLSKKNIMVDFQKYIHPTYKQIGQPFLPFMSIIDLLFNEGQDSYKILMSNNMG